MTDGCKLLFIATSTGTLSVLPVKYNPAVVGHCIKIYLDTEFFFFWWFCFFFFGGGGVGGGAGLYYCIAPYESARHMQLPLRYKEER